MKTQFQTQKEKDLIKAALFNMAFWNYWDLNILKQIISTPGNKRQCSVGELIRRKAVASRTNKRSMSTFRESCSTAYRNTQATLESPSLTLKNVPGGSPAGKTHYFSTSNCGDNTTRSEEHRKDNLLGTQQQINLPIKEAKIE